MKKTFKRIALLALVTFGFVLPGFANDTNVEDKTLLCKLFPSYCSVSTFGAGGSGHGGDKPPTDKG
jgi:hypothetical protein